MMIVQHSSGSDPSIVPVCDINIDSRNIGIIAATRATPHAANTGCSHLYHAISQAL